MDGNTGQCVSNKVSNACFFVRVLFSTNRTTRAPDRRSGSHSHEESCVAVSTRAIPTGATTTQLARTTRRNATQAMTRTSATSSGSLAGRVTHVECQGEAVSTVLELAERVSVSEGLRTRAQTHWLGNTENQSKRRCASRPMFSRQVCLPRPSS